LKRARAYFQEAIEKDPTYAPAYAGLAVWYDTAAAYSLLPASEAYPLSKVTAQKALSLDSTLAEAHVPLGVVKAEYEWDLPGAEEEFKRAISQNPNDLVAHQWYAEDVLEPEGRHDEAVVELKQAEQLDPSSLMSRAAVGYGFYFARNYDLAIDQEKRTLELEPSFPKAHQLLGLAYEQKGMLPEAVHEFETAVALDANPSYSLGLARAYALTGQKQKSAEILTSGAPQQHYAHAYQLALVYLAQGNRNEALSTLEKAQSDRCWMLIYANVDPRLDALRSDPRFQKILHAIRYS
jgi:tetratricopeptide (TPR) repeat protein